MWTRLSLGFVLAFGGAPVFADASARAMEVLGAYGCTLESGSRAALGAAGLDEAAISELTEAALAAGYTVEVIADHGNADKMRNPDGSPNTAHTTALVPHLIARDGFNGPIRPGKLGDVAPTILHLMGLNAPEAMTGDVLV